MVDYTTHNVKVKCIEKEIETMDSYINRINDFLENKDIINVQFINKKEALLRCFITYYEPIIENKE